MDQEAYLDFEKNIAEIDERIEGLRHVTGSDDDFDLDEEVSGLEKKLEKILDQTYAKLTPWQKTQVARHPKRPHCLDYINGLITDFQLLAGDRLFGEDEAVVGGIGRFRGRSVVVIGQEKGNDIETRLKHNFGMAKPEGYRKAVRLMKLADQFNMPVLTFVDTAGAYPGLEGEERGQAEAIASSIDACFSVGVPIVATVIGEGGSGGAIAIAAANRILMLEHSVYSVISPEGCASILWRDGQEAKKAAEALRLTAQDLKDLGVIDDIIAEPRGGAHRNPTEAVLKTGEAISGALADFNDMTREQIRREREEKFLKMTRTE